MGISNVDNGGQKKFGEIEKSRVDNYIEEPKGDDKKWKRNEPKDRSENKVYYRQNESR